MRKTNTSTIANLSLIVLFLIFSTASEVWSQRDSSSLAKLIKETNDFFLYPYAQGVLLSPYELQEHNRDQMIKNIGWVTSFKVYRSTSSKKDSVGISFTVQDNQTLLRNNNNHYKSTTYAYYEDGRIHKIFRGKRLDDLFLNDEDGFLIQHGFGGELKRAKRSDKTFEWYNVRKDRLEYIISYDDQNRVSEIKTLGHYFGPAVEYEIEKYLWQEKRLISKNTIRKYKEGSIDSMLIKLSYDSLGLITGTSSRDYGQTTWSSNQFDTKVEYQEDEHLNISISSKGKIMLSITFDHYDNMVKVIRPYDQQKRVIKYRERKRQRSLFERLGLHD